MNSKIKKIIAALVIMGIITALVLIVAIAADWSVFEAVIYGIAIIGCVTGGVLLSIGLFLLLEWASD